MAAKRDKNAPMYTKTPFKIWSSSKNISASKLNQIAAPRKATEEIKKFKENIKIDKDVYNAREFIQDKIEKKMAEQLSSFIEVFKKRIIRQISTIKKDQKLNDRIKDLSNFLFSRILKFKK